MSIAVEHIEDVDMAALRIMRRIGRIVERLPRSTRRCGFGIGAAGRLAVVPDDQDVRTAVAIDELEERLAIGTACDVIHAIADLIPLARDRIDSVGTEKYFSIAFNEWPQQG